MAVEIKPCGDAYVNRVNLPRVLGLWDIISIVIGGVIGSGIFLVPKSIASVLPSPLLMLSVWVVGGLLSYFGALAFAELGAAMPEAGGMYVFLREAYGPLLSFLFGWTLFLVIDSGAIATLTVAFTSRYLPYFFKMSPSGHQGGLGRLHRLPGRRQHHRRPGRGQPPEPPDHHQDRGPLHRRRRHLHLREGERFEFRFSRPRPEVAGSPGGVRHRAGRRSLGL